jgi:hypothetical protein
MENLSSVLNGYIAAYRIPSFDPVLEKLGFSKGMVLFSIPGLGILFRCRADGKLIDLEFAAFFALLKFTETKLAGQKVKAVRVLSSNPEFLFAFTSSSNPALMNPDRQSLLAEYQKSVRIEVVYVQPRSNEALVSVANCSPLPASQQITLPRDPASDKPQFKPFQTGFKL